MSGHEVDVEGEGLINVAYTLHNHMLALTQYVCKWVPCKATTAELYLPYYQQILLVYRNPSLLSGRSQ